MLKVAFGLSICVFFFKLISYSIDFRSFIGEFGIMNDGLRLDAFDLIKRADFKFSSDIFLSGFHNENSFIKSLEVIK